MEALDAASIPTRLLDDANSFFVEEFNAANLHPLSSTSARLLDVPPLVTKEFRTVLNDLRERQEELFRQVLDQQKELQGHLLDMHSTFREGLTQSKAAELASPLGDWMRSANQNGVRQSNGSEAAEAAAAEKAATLAATISDGEVSDDATSSNRASKASHNEEVAKAMEQAGAFRPSTNSTTAKILDWAEHLQTDKLLESKEFEVAIAVAILVNAFIMCWETQYVGLDLGFDLQYPGREREAHAVWKGAETVFTAFDWLFGFMFTLEMLAKLYFWRRKYFYIKPPEDPQRKYLRTREPSSPFHDDSRRCERWRFLTGVQGWNLLDCFCVFGFLVSKVGVGGGINPQTLRLLRLFRLGRLVRLLRFLESLDHLYVMTTAISGLKEVLAWAIILLTMMLLTCDLLLVQILHDTYFSDVKASELTQDQLQKYQEVYSYFGTCTRCMLSMFEITLGNWPPVARLLSEEVSEWFTFFCLAHKLTIGFAVIGVITGVILQETFKVAQTDDIIMFRQKKTASYILRKKMAALFDTLDDSRDGRLEVDEFRTIAEVPEIKVWLGSLGIETDDLHTLFSLIDVDDNGYITLDELVQRMPRLQGSSRSLDVLAMQRQMWQQAKRKRGSTRESKHDKASFADFLLEQDLPRKPGSRTDLNEPARLMQVHKKWIARHCGSR